MTTSFKPKIEALLNAFAAKDTDAFLEHFADNAVLFDPHYPEPIMQGKAAMRQGLGFIFNLIDKPGFSIRNFWSDGQNGAVELDTHHTFPDGTEARFPQVFVFETQDGLLTRLQSYGPHPPPAA